jgi:predicted NodU family carbamoyl transferase
MNGDGARRAGLKHHLNAKIKLREEFRPFAPVVTELFNGTYFETLGMTQSPDMLFTHRALQPAALAAVVHTGVPALIEDYLVEKE